MNSFDQKKHAILTQIGATSEENPDASPKGTLDTALVPLIDLINKHPDMVTTSSCSGRVSVFLEGTKVAHGKEKVGGKGAGGKWLYITHDRDELAKAGGQWWQDVRRHVEPYDDTDVRRYLLYKFEPMILHVKCRDQETASKLYSTAMSCGYRESGIGSNCLVGIRISIRLDAPLGYLECLGNEYTFKPIVADEYVQELETLSLELFDKNMKRINDLTEQMHLMFEARRNEPQKETKEERRERKRREGLLRQQKLQSQSNDS